MSLESNSCTLPTFLSLLLDIIEMYPYVVLYNCRAYVRNVFVLIFEQIGIGFVDCGDCGISCI